MAVALKIQICVYLSPLTSYIGQNLCFPSNTTSLLVGLREPWVSFFPGLIPGVLLLSNTLILEFWKSFLFLWSFFRPENLLSYLTNFISHISYPTGFIYLFIWVHPWWIFWMTLYGANFQWLCMPKNIFIMPHIWYFYVQSLFPSVLWKYYSIVFLVCCCYWKVWC